VLRVSHTNTPCLISMPLSPMPITHHHSPSPPPLIAPYHLSPIASYPSPRITFAKVSRVSHGYSYHSLISLTTHITYHHSFIHPFTTHTHHHLALHSLIPLTSYHSPFSITHHYSFIHHSPNTIHHYSFITTHSFTITYLIHSYPSYHYPLPRTITSYHHLPRSLTNSYPSPIARSYHPPT